MSTDELLNVKEAKQDVKNPCKNKCVRRAKCQEKKEKS
jgi:hypothetical protein